MKPLLLPLLCPFLMLTACSSIEKTHIIYRLPSWSSSDPLSIPYETRLAQFKKGSLAPNASFEGGSASAGGPPATFKIESREKVGRNLLWVEQETVPGTVAEAGNGRHHIKIIRKKATELDEAEGVLSDYIPVIPGNHYFTYKVKLKDISSSRCRLGVKLHGTIIVKVLFFDESRQPLDAGYLNPVSGGPIDNSDKGYSFANYWRIDDFPWGTVRGRSYNYPFSEGDIPDGTRFVRLFFGLKGTGNMWLDDIDYRYSKWNFTALERFKPFFDKQLPLAEKIIPTPKRFEATGDIAYCDAANPQPHPPVIVLPENPAPAERTAAKMLQTKISAVSTAAGSAKNGRHVNVRILEKDIYFDGLSDTKLILSIGKNNVYQKFQPDLPWQSIRGQNQAYIIKTERVGNCYIVFLMGATPIGSYYASATALQLFENDEFVYHSATIIDYPDFWGRSYVFKNWKTKKELHRDLDAVERMSLYKLNKVYSGYDREIKHWYQPDELYREGLKAAGKICKESGVMSLAVMVNPYSHFAMGASAENLNDQLRYTWSHSNPESFKMLTDVYKIGLEAGADTVMLLSDDFLPYRGKNRFNYTLYTAEDKNRFVNLQNAQAHVINSLKQWIEGNYPETRFEFCPPWYSNEHIDRSDGKAEIYFKELIFQIPPDVAVMWTGPTIRSLSIDMADLNRYRSLIDRWPMIWDNTLYARNLETKRYGGIYGLLSGQGEDVQSLRAL